MQLQVSSQTQPMGSDCISYCRGLHSDSVDCRSLVVGCWSVAGGCWSFVVGCWLLVVSCRCLVDILDMQHVRISEHTSAHAKPKCVKVVVFEIPYVGHTGAQARGSGHDLTGKAVASQCELLYGWWLVSFPTAPWSLWSTLYKRERILESNIWDQFWNSKSY